MGSTGFSDVCFYQVAVVGHVFFARIQSRRYFGEPVVTGAGGNRACFVLAVVMYEHYGIAFVGLQSTILDSYLRDGFGGGDVNKRYLTRRQVAM